MSQFGWRDCPADVRQQVDYLIARFRAQLAARMIGVYLHGSLAMNCFNPLRSDIDLLVVTESRMSMEIKRNLAELMLRASLRPARVEISFIERNDLRPWRHPAPYDFHYSEDWRETFERELKNGAWRHWGASKRLDEDLAAHIFVLNRRGICLDGEKIREVFPEVPESDFIASVLEDVLHHDFGLPSVLRNPVYVVLNACRTLAFLREKRVLSKKEGGEWALSVLPAKFRPLIDDALDEYRRGTNESVLKKEPLLEIAAYLQSEIENAARSNRFSR